MSLDSSSFPVSIFIIYKPPPSINNNLSHTMFIDEFSQFLEQFSITSSSLLIVGDFNFHVEDPTDSSSLQFLNLLDLFNLSQHVKQATYNGKHILDLVITSTVNNIVNKVNVFDPVISDHSAVFCDLLIKKPSFENIALICRKLKSINMESFQSDVACSSLVTSPKEDLAGLTSQYNSVLSSLLDSYAPAKERIITLRPSNPWYTEEIRKEKIKRRKLERTWRRSRLTIHRDLYVEQCHVVKRLIQKSKNEYFSNVINDNKFDQKVLFSTFDKWLNRETQLSLPSAPSPKYLANSFAEFFLGKIRSIQSNLTPCLPVADTPDGSQVLATSELNSFFEVSQSELSKLIPPLVLKSCDLDPIPGKIMKTCFECLIPCITRIVNLSLSTATMPTTLKEALVKPSLKKQNLSTEDFSSFRPISNLTFLSKVIERVVANQLENHLVKNDFHEVYQSAYKKFHSVETALLKVQNDILLAIDKQSAVILVLLDLSAAFDTVDHAILLERLSSRYAINGMALQWFQSYLSNRYFRVKVQGHTSLRHPLQCGVPQGSILGPILFLLYTSPLGDIVRKYNINFHLYADDTQLYLTFSPSCPNDLYFVKQQIESCVLEINNWMTYNKLKLNNDKTEILILSNAHRPRPPVDSLNFEGYSIAAKSSARNIGVLFDEALSLDQHIQSVCKSCFLHIHQLWKIRRYLSHNACVTLVHAFISSKLDFCNSLLYGLPKGSLKKLQHVQNAAARLVTFSRNQEHITPILYNLHWLPVEQRIIFKILLLTFKI